MTYDDRPWLARYDPGVNPDIEVPETSLVTQFDKICEDFSERAALHFYGVTLNYAQLSGCTNQFARALVENGCRRGDVVTINLPNIPQYLIAQIGALKAGCATSGMSPLMTAREMSYQLRDSHAKILLTLDAIFQQRVVGIADEVPDLKLVFVTGILDFLGPVKRMLGRLIKKIPHGKIRPLPKKTVIKFMDVMKECSESRLDVTVEGKDTCLVQYTGGTTGLPKGTILAHWNITANLTQIEHWIKPEFGKEVLLSGFPLFHLAGLALCLASIFMGAAQILIPNPRDTRHITGEMKKYKPTMLVNVPSLYMMLLEEHTFRKLDFSHLSFCLSGASPFPMESIRELEKIVGSGKVLEVYGMTEASPLITMNPRKGKKKVGTVGLPLPSTIVRLVDLENGDEQASLGREGEIVVNGPQIMQGYLNKPAETAIALREHDGKIWLHTGDVARMDEDGFVTIVDRTKDMLNVGGFKVFSREVEEKLYEHPAIDLCAIIGLPNPRRPGSEHVKLVVQLKPEHRERDQDEVKNEIIAFARKNFAPYKVPKTIDIMNELPLTSVGKVDKKVLRT